MEKIINLITENGAKIFGWIVSIFTIIITLITGGGLPDSNVTDDTAKMIEIAGYAITDEEADTIKEGFAEAGKDLGEGGGMEARREIVLTETFTKDGETSVVVYNFTDGAYYVVPSEFSETYMRDDNFRRLGAPVGEMGENYISGNTTANEIEGKKYISQIFEKGVLLISGDEIQMYVGAPEKTKKGIVIHPIVDDQDLIVKKDGNMGRLEGVDGEMHPLKEVTFTSTKKGYTLYANYSSCCVYLELGKDYTVKSQLIFAGKNYIKQENGYTAKILPIECISVDDMIKDGAEPVDADALAYYQQFNRGAAADDVIAKFREAYEELYKNGFVAGYRCSKIKMWTYLVLDLRFGDGTTGFDEVGSNGRERMTCLVYNPVKDKVYPVNGEFFLIWKEDGDTGRNVLGYPESGIILNADKNGTVFASLQNYENGYIGFTEKGESVIYDSKNAKFLSAAPKDEETTIAKPQGTVKPQVSAKPQSTPSKATTAQLTEIAGYKLTEAEAKAIKNGFSKKGESLGQGSGVEARREIILTETYSKDGKSNMVVYNFEDKKYYVVPSEILDTYMLNDNFRKLGAPVSSMAAISVSGTTDAEGKIKSGKYTAQVFEKGVILISGDSPEVFVGAVEAVSGGVKIHPILNDQDLLIKGDGKMVRLQGVDGELHPLKSIDFKKAADGYTLYANYSSCCVYLKYSKDYYLLEQRINMAKNYIKSSGTYSAKALPIECITVEDMISDGEEPVDADALAYYKKFKPSATEKDLVAKFAAAYEELYRSGFVPGYRCSKIKMWSHLVLDLRFGDGTTGFDETGSGGRERMTCLVYNPDKDAIYPVYGPFFTIWKEDGGTGRNTLGCPESKVLYNKAINNTVYKEVQLFKNGYIYRSDKGNYRAVLGSEYSDGDGGFKAAPTPGVPDRFGAETARKSAGDTVYINYQKGAIRCDLTFNKSQYRYTFLRGRNFNLESGSFEVSLLPLNELIDLSSLTSEGTMPTKMGKQVSFDDVIKPKLISKYTELYNSGFFCGFPEEVFKGAWNNVYAQQFVVGDSSSMIFGEDRPYVSALVYNPKTDTVYLMRDDVIKTWQSVYATAGSPTSDEYQLPGCDAWFQTFDFGMTIRRGNLIVFTEEFKSPEDYVQQMNENPLKVPTHEKNPEKGYIG